MGNEFFNTYEESLFSFCDENSSIVKYPNELFSVNRHLKGGNVFDFYLCKFTVSNNLSEFYAGKDAEFFTSVPNVSHWPVCFSLLVSNPEKFTQNVLEYSEVD